MLAELRTPCKHERNWKRMERFVKWVKVLAYDLGMIATDFGLPHKIMPMPEGSKIHEKTLRKADRTIATLSVVQSLWMFRHICAHYSDTFIPISHTHTNTHTHITCPCETIAKGLITHASRRRIKKAPETTERTHYFITTWQAAHAKNITDVL